VIWVRRVRWDLLVPLVNRVNPVPREFKVCLEIRDLKVLKVKRAIADRWALLDRLVWTENMENWVQLDQKARRVNPAFRVHPDLVVLTGQKDPKEVPVTLDSPDPMANPAYKDLKEKMVKMVSTARSVKRDSLVILDLLVKWVMPVPLVNLVLKVRRVFRAVPDFPVIRVKRVVLVFLARREHQVIKEIPDHKVLRACEVPLDLPVTLVHQAKPESLATLVPSESWVLPVKSESADVADPKVIEENWVLPVVKVMLERRERLE